MDASLITFKIAFLYDSPAFFHGYTYITQTEQEMKEEIEREESVAEETVDAEEKMDDEDNGAGDGWTVVTRKR